MGGDSVDAVTPPVRRARERRVFGEVEQQRPGGRSHLREPDGAAAGVENHVGSPLADQMVGIAD